MNKTIFVLRLITVTLVLVLNILPLTKILAQQVIELSDPSDTFVVHQPVANTTIRGNQNISFTILDDDIASLEYTVRLFDTVNCKTTSYGNITSGTISSANQGTVNYLWNSRTTSSISNVADGSYCIQICTTFYNGATPYSACNGRTVYIANNNTPPTITSVPTKLILQTGESFSYQVNATDSQNDPLRYRIIAAPAGMEINPQTGLVYSNPFYSAPGTTSTYQATIGVDDGYNSTTTQSFVFNVVGVAIASPAPVAPSVPTTPTTPTPTTPNVPTTPATPNTPTDSENDNVEKYNLDKVDFRFIYPENNSILTTSKYPILWNIENKEFAFKISLEYKNSESDSWNRLTEIDMIKNYYIWDVSSLEPGKYVVRAVLQDDNQRTRYVASGQFELADLSGEQGEDDGVSTPPIPVFSNIIPAIDSNISSEVQVISGDIAFAPDSEYKTDSFKLFINGAEFSENCTINQNKFICNNLNLEKEGLYLIKVEALDSEDNLGSFEWKFSIGESKDAVVMENSNNSNPFEFLGDWTQDLNWQLIGIVALVLFIAIVALVTLGNVWRNSLEVSQRSVFDSNRPVDDTTYYAPPIDTYYQPTYGAPATQNIYEPVPVDVNYTYNPSATNPQ